MATGPTGFLFKKDGVFVDFYNVFQPENNDIVTGYKSGSTDLGNLFMTGDSGIVTGYKSDGIDLGNLFINTLPFTATGASITGITSSYYYAIFTGAGTVIPNTSTSNLYFVCVGGGGGGGGAQGGTTCGGGGGAGVYLISTSDMTTDYLISIGTGGAGGPPGGSGGTGGLSQVIKNGTNTFIVKSDGGMGGTDDTRGNGGQSYINNNITPVTGYNGVIITGGAGGDAGDIAISNGEPCYFNEKGSFTLDVPPELINIDTNSGYISNYYSGGGGGGKGTKDGSNYTGGQGGGTSTDTGSSPYYTNTGLGGVCGEINQEPTSGSPGNGYGSGGGAGGRGSGGTAFAGGAGKQGIIICYSLLTPPNSIATLNLQSYSELYRNNCDAVNSLNTNVGITIGSSFANTFQANGATTSTTANYGTINPSFSLLNTTILVDMYTTSTTGTVGLCNLFFGNNSSGAGFMVRLDGRSGFQSGIATTTSWTVWNAPTGTGINLLSNVWYTFVISIDSSGNISWAAQKSGTDMFVNNTIYSSLNTGVTTTVSSSNTWLAVNGDRLSGSISYFDNIIIYDSAIL
jgi:hypothetical protein